METMLNTQLLPIQQSAVDLLNEGFSVLPVHGYDHRDKPKAPAVPSWKQYQTNRMDRNNVAGLFRNGCSLAVIGGHVSGNLECLDFDNPALFKPFMNILEEINAGLAERLVQRATPSGGYHLIYRCEAQIDTNMKLAESRDGQTWIETRGEGGYFLTTPSPGYTALKHDLKDTPVISGQDRELLLNLARSLSARPSSTATCNAAHTSEGTRPGDAFNRRHAHDIADMLESNGWSNSERISAGGQHWTRPGKDRGTSATLKNGCLYVFSTNTDIPPGPHDAFGIYAYLMHGGDFAAAGRDLAAKGYGENSSAADLSNVQQEEDTWPDPLPVGAELPAVEPVTREMIPEPFRDWVMDAADRMQIPVDFIIAPLLVVCGSTVGTSCRIRPKQKDDWSVVPNLWGGIVGPPSMLKTPALTEAVNKTLGRLEVAAREDHAEAINEYEADAMLRAAREKAIKADIEKTARDQRQGRMMSKSLDELAEEYKKLKAYEVPTERRYKTNDSSIEKIVELLEQNPRGLLYFRDELIGLFKRTERAGNEQDRAFLLESWNGDGSHTDDRIGRGTVRTDNLCISLLGGIQPDKIAGYLHGAISDSDNDGFVQRLQLMVYPDPLSDWCYQDKAPDIDARNRGYGVIERLASMEVAGVDLFEKPYLRFSVEGQEVFKQWLSWLETRKLTNRDEHPVILEHLAKYRSLMPSLALIFHLIEVAGTAVAAQPGPVSKNAALMAAAWCQYLESHARRIYSLALDIGQAGAARLSEKIQAGKLGMGFTRPEVVRKKWGMLTRKNQVQEAIDYLVEMNWLRETLSVPGDNQGGRPAAISYLVNPKIFSEGTGTNAPKPLKPV